ncbi:MAG: nucleotidyl transferase AbiEii/AbiGii toxin family protein [Halofilum sp. (in: g-proteobacteria)]|nr:nucleotidyl transferase AbiEii/AbiGii toxin family protein [Halofilum sp. (in: g-proteobacteria)]
MIRLGEFAADIRRHPLLSRVLALKGGTALNLLLGVPARLSVDLDFNYVGQTDRERMQSERPQVEHALEVIGQGQGYRVQRSRAAHAGRKLYLSYTSVAGTADRIEVDLNFLYRTPLGDLSRRAMWQPPGFERPEVTIVPLEELAAGKLRATLDRAMPRDLFDTVRLPHATRWNLGHLAAAPSPRRARRDPAAPAVQIRAHPFRSRHCQASPGTARSDAAGG